MTISKVSIDKSQFIIYTNKKIDSKFSENERQKTEVNIFFKTNDKEILNLNPDKKRKKLYTPLENVVKNSKIFRGWSGPGLKSVIREFLNKLILATGQKSHWILDELIVEEICNNDEIKVEYDKYISVVHHYKTPLENWWRKKERETMTAETLKKWPQKAKTKYNNPVHKSCKKKLLETEIHFSDSAISWHQAELSNNRAVHLRSDALTLCTILLLDCLDTSKCISLTFESLQSNKKCCCLLCLEVTGNGLLCSVIQQFGQLIFQTHAWTFVDILHLTTRSNV